MEDDTQIRSARRGLLASVLVLLIVAVGAVGAGIWYFLNLDREHGGQRTAPSLDTARQKLLLEEDTAPPEPYQSWYPAQVLAPPGSRYKMAITPLPKGIDGIPQALHRYVDHSLALILSALYQRQIAWDGLGPVKPPAGLLEGYLKQTKEVARKLKAEPTPKSLEAFRDDMVAALELQMSFFQHAYEWRGSGQTWDMLVNSIPEAKQASAKLMEAYSLLVSRFPGLPPATAAALHDPLCALDIF